MNLISLICLSLIFWFSATAQYLPGAVHLQTPQYSPKVPRAVFKQDALLEETCAKKVINDSAIYRWFSLGINKPRITSDGKYFMYGISNFPYKQNTLVLQSTNGSWRKTIVGVKEGFFSEDGERFIYMSKSSLYILCLGTDSVMTIENVSSYHLPSSGNGRFLMYQQKTDNLKLMVSNLISGDILSVDNVKNYKFYEEGSVLFVVKSNGEQEEAWWFDLETGNAHKIWAHNRIQVAGYYLDVINKQICLLISETHQDKMAFSVWYFKIGMPQAIPVLNDSSEGITSGLKIMQSASPVFTKNGRYLAFYLKADRKRLQDIENSIQVDIWGYRDSILQSSQHNNLREETLGILAAVSVDSLNSFKPPRVVLWTREGEHAVFSPNTLNCEFLLVKYHRGGDRFWENKASHLLVSMNDGSRIMKWTKDEHFWFSPDGGYLLEYDTDKHHYYSLELKSLKKALISRNINSLNFRSPFHKGDRWKLPIGVAGWLNDFSVLVYDNYDIWKLDLSGKVLESNVTRGYGRLNKIIIRLVEEDKYLKCDDKVVVSLFNPRNKNNGLFLMTLNNSTKIDAFLERVATYYNTGLNQAAAVGLAVGKFEELMKPVKTADSAIWLIKRQSAVSAPNYYLTKDFKFYRQLTDLQPQLEYNWLTAELLEWTKPDRTVGQGVLYKPENFDPCKKYALIIYYYEWYTGCLNQFPVPDFTVSTHPNIAWFVSCR